MEGGILSHRKFSRLFETYTAAPSSACTAKDPDVEPSQAEIEKD